MSKKQKLKNWKWVPLILSGVVILAYANGLNNDFVSDDISAIVDNPHRAEFLWNARQWPMGAVLYGIRSVVARVAGLNPIPYRLVNVLFHLGTTNLLFLILSGTIGFGLAFASALIFAVHPILVEGVTWISGVPYSGYAFFILLAFWLYRHEGKRINYWLSIVSYLAALSFQAIGMAFAPILTIYEIFNKRIRKSWWKLIPFWLIGGIFALFMINQVSAREAANAIASGWTAERYNSLIQIPVAIGSYVQLFFWPDKLTLYHSEMSFTENGFGILVVISLVVLALFIWGLFKEKRLSFWLAWFVLSIAPTLTPWGVNWVVAERYVYLGTIGLVVSTLVLYQRLIGRRIPREINLSILLIISILLLARTITRNADWKNQDSLWLATAKYSPSSAQNHNNLGDVYSRRKDYAKAVEEFKTAIAINPRYADAYHNLGNAYLSLGKLNEAENSYYKALEFNPKLWQSAAQLEALKEALRLKVVR